MVAINRQSGLDNGSGPRVQRPATLCVHFASAGRCVSFAEAAPAEELDRAGAARLTIEWDLTSRRVSSGRALLRGEVACDAYLLRRGEGDAASTAHDRDLLRAAGMPKDRASLLERMPERPLLATVAHGPEMSPQLMHRIHGLLLAAAEVWGLGTEVFQDRPSAIAAAGQPAPWDECRRLGID